MRNHLRTNRRKLFSLGAAAGVTALVPRTPGAVSAPTDPTATRLRFRQVHLDFHTSEHVKGVAADFDPEAFAATLKKAHVDSVTVFARCHHGYMYYDTKQFKERIHPGLQRKNLLGEQIEACHKFGIRTPIYVTIQWDQFTADQHPEWRVVTSKGELQGPPPHEAGFTRRLCLNSPFVDFINRHIDDLFDTVPVDGFFLDIVAAQDCSCVHCMREMRSRGLDPGNEAARLAFGTEVTNRWKTAMTARIRKRSQTATIFYNGGHVGPDIRPTLKAYSHLELESLPSGGWGYMHFPLTIRYARNLGLDRLGMTGKFHTSWGDFHSLKNKAALELECFSMLAMGAKCSIGDQLHPQGKLEPATYDLIGSVYASVEAKEPWCTNAKPLVDIAVVSPEESPGNTKNRLIPAARGVVRILQEGAHQFDMIDSASDLSPYRLVILPDEIIISPTLKNKLEAFVGKGGALITTGKSSASDAAFARNTLGVTVKGEAPFSPDFILARNETLGAGIPRTELVIYEKGQELVPLAGTEVLADVFVPYFNRTAAHYFSHKHAPSSRKLGYPGAVRKGRCITFAHPLCTQYALNAPIWCKKLLLNAIAALLPQPLVQITGPSSVVTALNEQAQEKRRVLHLLHYIPERRGDEFDVVEDILPVHDLAVSVRSTTSVTRVRTVPEGIPIAFKVEKGRINFTLPVLRGHQMIEIG